MRTIPADLLRRVAPLGLAAAAMIALGFWARTAAAQPAPAAQRIAAAPAAEAAGGGVPRVAIGARDYAFDAPDSVQAGVASYTLRNQGPEPHHAQFLRLNDGVTMAQFGAALMQGPEAALPLVSTRGGPGAIDAGKTQEVTLDLPAGQYVMVCFIESADGVPHLAKGMIKPFEVTPPPTGAQPPASDSTIVMRDFSFTLPQMQAGERTITVVNQGPQPHEASLIKAPAGVTLSQLTAALMDLSAPPPFMPEDDGGIQAMNVGQTGWMTLNLSPGAYVFMCFVPDPVSGKPHAELGMVAPFEVR
jgi:plastocyanin